MSLLCRWEKWDPAIVDHLFQVLHLGRGGTGLNGPGYSLLCCGIFIMLLRGFLLRHSLFGLFVKFCIFFPHFMYWIWNSFTSLVMLYSLGGRSLLRVAQGSYPWSCALQAFPLSWDAVGFWRRQIPYSPGKEALCRHHGSWPLCHVT